MAVFRVSPEKARAAIANGATLIDIRKPDEHASEHIAGALNRPVSRIATTPLPSGPIIFHCRSGARTDANAARLAAVTPGAPCYLLEGGINAWRKRGFATIVDRGQPLEVMPQVQLVAGALILAGVLLSWTVGPAFAGLSAFVGAGLMFAGATGWCGLARLLRHMPWNRASA